MNWSDINFFQPSETVCKCGCGENNISLLLMERVDWLRIFFNVPFTVISGCRCPRHNIKEGGADSSFHVPWGPRVGRAIDVTVRNKSLLPTIYRVAVASNKFNGVGIRENSIVHLDIGDRPQPYYYIYLPSGIRPLCPEILQRIQSESILEHMVSLC